MDLSTYLFLFLAILTIKMESTSSLSIEFRICDSHSGAVLYDNDPLAGYSIIYIPFGGDTFIEYTPFEDFKIIDDNPIKYFKNEKVFWDIGYSNLLDSYASKIQQIVGFVLFYGSPGIDGTCFAGDTNLTLNLESEGYGEIELNTRVFAEFSLFFLF